MSTTEHAIPDLKIVGDSNHVVQVGSLVTGSTYIQKTERQQGFFEVQLATLREASTPAILEQLVEHTQRKGVTLLGGAYDDKPTLARQVARQLAEDRRWRGGAQPAMPVLEWYGTGNFADLLRSIEQQEKPAVFVLPNLLPQSVGYDLLRLRKVTALGHHTLVASTEQSKNKWSVAQGNADFWYPLEASGLFTAESLKLELLAGLERLGGTLPAGVLDEDAAGGPTLAGVSLMEIADALETPWNVEFFLQRLAAAGSGQELTRETINGLTRDAASVQNRVEKWFHAVLQPREQLLALSLAFFDDLYDDQYFAALELWVDDLRTRRDPAQRAFDYHDMDAMDAFVTQVESSLAGTRFTSRWPGQRRLLLQSAWRTHRRAVLSALPVLARLAADSAVGRADNWELYGSSERRAQLRNAIGGVLSDIGLLSRASVQHALLQLAADPEFEVQSVAARAVARWRESGAHEQLFETLKGWQLDARLQGVIEAILEGRKKEKADSPMSYIRATIAVAVAYASGYDAPGSLHPDLLELVETLADDRNVMVRDRFARFTLPTVVALHLRQLRPALRRMMNDAGLAQHIGASLAFAYRTMPDEVVDTLAEWRRETEPRPSTIDPRRLTPRDKLLISLAFTYGEIEYTPDGPISASDGFAWLRHVLATERHPRVRSAAVVAISMQARRSFTHVEPLMHKVVAEVMGEEHDEVVGILLEIYRTQREALPGGTVQRTIKDREYWLWADSPQPRTEVESALLRWLCDASIPAAQQVAMKAFMAFAVNVDLPVDAELQRFREGRRRKASADAAAQAASTPARIAAEPGWYTGSYVPWLATLGAGQYTPVIRGLLPEALAQNASRNSTLIFLLAKWESAEGDTGPVARHLRSALSWHSIGWLLFPLGALVLWILLAVLV